MSPETSRYQDEIRRLAAAVFRVEPASLPEDLAFGDIPQWDSLGHMDLLMSLEERYRIELDEALITRLTSLAAICAYLEEDHHA